MPTKSASAYGCGRSSGFAHLIGTTTLNSWTEKHPELLDAVTPAKEMQKEILVANGLSGPYNDCFAQFVARNFTDMEGVGFADNSCARVITQQ